MSADAPIKSRANPLVKRFRSLKERGPAEGLCLLEGPRLVREALQAGVMLVEAVVSPRARAWDDLVADLRAHGVPVRVLDDDLLASLSEAETSQGLLALARTPAADEERFFARTPLVVVLAGVQNPGNVGALLRSAEAAGATGAYLTTGTADPFSWKALRGSMGSAFRLPLSHGAQLEHVLATLARRGVPTLAASAANAEPYGRVDMRGPVALLLGNEGAGLPADVLARASRRLRIPMAEPVESLNVSVAGAVLLFEAARQRGQER